MRTHISSNLDYYFLNFLRCWVIGVGLLNDNNNNILRDERQRQKGTMITYRKGLFGVQLLFRLHGEL
jgi:hypothetical protein